MSVTNLITNHLEITCVTSDMSNKSAHRDFISYMLTGCLEENDAFHYSDYYVLFMSPMLSRASIWIIFLFGPYLVFTLFGRESLVVFTFY